MNGATRSRLLTNLGMEFQELNKEGRRRLLSSFNEVNKHFQELFIRLFAGGKAHLTLVDPADDPLDAGIEIMARPPEKDQTLSLLSGVESKPLPQLHCCSQYSLLIPHPSVF